MATQDFSKIYYRTTNCLTSDIIADFAPVSRVLGVDTSSGMGVVFTAMGTRFDMQYVAKEAFMATENYEADTRSIDDTPVAEVMRYVRSEVIAGEQLPEKYWALTDRIKNEESTFGQYKAYSDGRKDGEILFLISPAAADAKKTADQFLKLADSCGKKAYATNEYKDCGYLLLQLGQTDAANAIAKKMEADLAAYETIVTDDSYVLDTLLVQFPELKEKIQFIDAFILETKGAIDGKAEKVVLHESGVIERLYPMRKVDYKELLKSAELLLPKRSGYDVTDSGMAGGLGLYEPENLMAIAGRRMTDLMEESHDVIVTPCACEAAGLNCAERETVLTLLDYISR